MRPIDKELILQPGVEAGETGDARQIFRLKVRPSLADRKAEIRRNPFREVDIDTELLRAVEAGGRASDRRQRHLVRDERIIGQDRRRKEPLAGKTVARGVVGHYS